MFPVDGVLFRASQQDFREHILQTGFVRVENYSKTQRLKEMVKLENTEDSVSYCNELEEDAKRKSAKTKEKEKEKEKEKGSTMMKEGGFLLSTKVRALVRDLKTIAETDSSAKSLVFSQFTMCLDLIELCLKKERLEFIRLDGKEAAPYDTCPTFNLKNISVS